MNTCVPKCARVSTSVYSCPLPLQVIAPSEFRAACSNATLNGAPVSLQSACVGTTAYVTPYLNTLTCGHSNAPLGTFASAAGACTAVPGTQYSYVATCPLQAAAVFPGNSSCTGAPVAGNIIAGKCVDVSDSDGPKFFRVTCAANGVGTLTLFTAVGCDSSGIVSEVSGASNTCTPAYAGGATSFKIVFTCLAAGTQSIMPSPTVVPSPITSKYVTMFLGSQCASDSVGGALLPVIVCVSPAIRVHQVLFHSRDCLMWCVSERYRGRERERE